MQEVPRWDYRDKPPWWVGPHTFEEVESFGYSLRELFTADHSKPQQLGLLY